MPRHSSLSLIQVYPITEIPLTERRDIYFVALGLGLLSVILAAFTRDVSPLLTNHVAVHLENESKESVEVRTESEVMK